MQYCLTEGVLSDEESIERKVYGISVSDSDGKLCAEYSDLFFDKEKAEEFVLLCSREKPELCHLSDLIEDILT